MPSKHASAYRQILRELTKASTSRSSANKTLSSSFRAMFEAHRPSDSEFSTGTGHASPQFERDIQSAIAFTRSQCEYKTLLARYNPLIDLTSEDRVKATARRVGLDMPITPNSSD